MNIEQSIRQYLTNPKVAAIIFIIITLIFSYPLYSRMNNRGMHDWDQHLFYEAVSRRSVLEYHQFPLWNPWQCGGNVLLANPQSPFLSIHFPLIILFGEVIATKLAIMLYLFIGLFGMWFLCRYLKMTAVTSYLPPIVLMLSGVYAIRIAVGHTNWFYIALIPWLFLCFLKAKENKKYIILSAALLTLIFIGGGVHPFAIAIVILATYAAITVFHEKNLQSIFFVLGIVFLFIFFSAVKLLPMLSVYNEMLPIEQTDIQPNNIIIILNALTERHSNLTLAYYADDGTPWYWHEYYGYIGVLPILLFIAAIFSWKIESRPYIFGAGIVLIIMLSQKLLPLFWTLLYKIPFVSVFHGPSRFLFAFIFFMSIAIGLLAESENKKVLLFAAIIIFIFVDLTIINSALFAKGLYLKPQQTSNSGNFYTIYAEDKEFFTEQYSTFLNNKGIWDCYERFYPAVQGAIPKMTFSGQRYDNYKGEVYSAETGEEQQITYWSPNKIKINVKVADDGILILNQNYISGWKAKVDGVNQVVLNYNGAVATTITKKSHEVFFYYMPTSFIIGLLISLAALLFSLIFLANLINSG